MKRTKTQVRYYCRAETLELYISLFHGLVASIFGRLYKKENVGYEKGGEVDWNNVVNSAAYLRGSDYHSQRQDSIAYLECSHSEWSRSDVRSDSGGSHYQDQDILN